MFTWAIIVAWSSLMCGEFPTENCMRWAQKCLVKEFVINGGDADLAFETCATEYRPEDYGR